MINEENIKKNKNIVIIASIIIAFLWLSFVSLFIITFLKVNDTNIVLFKILDSVLFVITLWVTIFLSFNLLSPAITKLIIIKKLLSYEEETFTGVITKCDVTRTVEKRIKAREIEIMINDKEKRLFYLEISMPFDGFDEGDVVTLKVRHNYITELKK